MVSDELTSLLIAQLSERHELDQVFSDLFQPKGCILEMRPVSMYVDGAATFEELVRAASAQSQSALGYRPLDGGVVLNPSKSSDPGLGPDDLLLVVRQSGIA